MFLKKIKRGNWTTIKEYLTYSLVESYKGEKFYQHKYIISVWTLDDFSENEIKTLEFVLVSEITWKTFDITTFPKKIQDKFHEVINKYYEKQKQEQKKEDSLVQEKDNRLSWEYKEISINNITTEDRKFIGNENICNETYNQLDIDTILKNCWFTKRQSEITRMLILWRLINPTSELWTLKWINQTSWLWELTWTDYTNLNIKTVYSFLPKLMNNMDKIEKHLESKERKIFELNDTIILYDLTNTYFEWKAEFNELAQYSKNSKEKRTDCPIVWLWFIVDKDWFPKASKVFKWNTSDSVTMESMIEDLEDRCDYKNRLIQQKPIVILDAGISSQSNLDYLKEHWYNYVVVAKTKNVQWEQIHDYELVKEMRNEFWTVQNKIEIRRNQTTQELFLECKSQKKNLKEKSIIEKLESLVEKNLENLNESIEKWTIKNKKTIERKIWQIQSKYSRVTQYYDIELIENKSKWEAKKKLKWEKNEEKKEAYWKKRERYILRTNLVDLEDEKIWDIYNTIRKVEDSFRTMKTDLRLRPIFHQSETNTIAHIFITVLAYHIVNMVLYKLKQSDINIRWSTFVKDMMTQTIWSINLQMIDWKRIKLRVVDEPTTKQRQYYKILNIKPKPFKPKQLTMID